MKTKMRATSLQALEVILPNLEDRELQVLKAIKKLQPVNNLMISKHLNLPINCITGRTNSLNKYHLIRIHDKRRCPYTNKRTIHYKIIDWINGVFV